MNYFPAVLDQLLQDAAGIDIAEASGLSETAISRARHGSMGIKPSTLKELCKAFAPADQWKLLRAYIIDVTPADMIPLITQAIPETIPGEVVQEGSSVYTAENKKIDAALERIRRSIPTNPDLKSTVLFLASVS